MQNCKILTNRILIKGKKIRKFKNAENQKNRMQKPEFINDRKTRMQNCKKQENNNVKTKDSMITKYKFPPHLYSTLSSMYCIGIQSIMNNENIREGERKCKQKLSSRIKYKSWWHPIDERRWHVQLFKFLQDYLNQNSWLHYYNLCIIQLQLFWLFKLHPTLLAILHFKINIKFNFAI